MPFKSKSQVRAFGHLVSKGEISKKKFREWLDETGDVKKLPEKKKRVKKAFSPLLDYFEKASTLTATGPSAPLVPKVSLEDIARSTYYHRLVRALNDPSIDENRRRDIVGALRDRATYGVHNPHVGIPPLTLLNKIRLALFGGMTIEPELRGEPQKSV